MRAVLALEVSVGMPAPPAVRRRSRAEGRARRWDAGPAPTARDLAALRFVGEQYAVRLDVAAVLLTRLSATGPERGGQLSRRAVREQLGRWEQAGWAERRRLLGHTWVTLTRTGLRLCGLEFEVWSPALDRLDHHHAAAVVRLYREPMPGRGGWVCERALWRRRGKASWHLADAALPMPVPAGWAKQGIGEAWELVEVELTQKARPRVVAALKTRPPHTAAVTYYVPAGLHAALAAQLAGVVRELGGRPPVTVQPLPEVAGTSYGGWPVSWHPQDPRSWGGWPPGDSRWGRHQPTWGWGHPARPLFDNQLGHRLPSGGPPARGELSMLVALRLFLLSPITLLAWAAGQGLLRATGLRWWKLALASMAALAVVIVHQGGVGPALAHHFAGYLWLLRQVGKPILHLPLPGAFLWPQLPLAVPVGLLAAALNAAGRPRQAIDPAEVRRTQRQATKRMTIAVRRAARVRDDHFGPVALGVHVDGDLGWTDKHGMIVVPRYMQGRSRLIVGGSGTGKTTDIEREAFGAARSGRKFFVIDGKGTDPTFVERALAGYLWGNPHARVGIWPELPMDGWRGTPAAIHNRLLAMLAWSEPYYKDIASLLLRLALNAPGEDGPVRSSQQLMSRMDPEALAHRYEHDPDRLREARSLCGREQARAVQGAISRLANFFAAVAGGFDAAEGGYSFEDIDFGYFRAPYLAGREDADACCRLLLEDFAHYATLRKPRKGEDATLVFDEFSAIAGGRETAIQLTERVRDAGCAVYLSAQSADGLGDERQQARLVGACSGGLLLHAMPNPHGLLQAAGMVRVVEQTWRLDPEGLTGNSSARIGERPKIDPGAVQQGREGEAWLIARGRYEHLMVARTAISDGYVARARAIVALARSWRPTEALPGARAWRDAQAAAQGALAGLVEHLAIGPPPDHTAEDNDPNGGPPPAGHAAAESDTLAEPPQLAAVRSRLRLAVAAAARDGDTEATAALVREGVRRGVDGGELLAVAERHWPRLRTGARHAAGRWAVGGARWAWTHRPHRQAGALLHRGSRP